MTTPESHFDKTVWDPINPEQAVEDPMHGSEALMNLLTTPPMPLPDGTYHVFGAYYLIGTNTFDSEGKPFIRFTSGVSTMQMIQDVRRMEEWHEIVSSGELPEGYPENPAKFFDLAAKPYFVIDSHP